MEKRSQEEQTEHDRTEAHYRRLVTYSFAILGGVVWLVMGMLILLASGCSAAPDGSTELELDDTEEFDGHYWAEPDFDDDPAALVEKTSLAALHGWSVKSKLQLIEGQFVAGPRISSYPSVTTVPGESLGRCGKTDGSSGFLIPATCILPFSPLPRGPKTFHVSFANCPADAAKRTIILNGVRQGFAAAQVNTSWTFVESAFFPNITIRCSNAAETLALDSTDTIATGVPTGPIVFQHSALLGGSELCEPDNGAPYPITTDNFWSYNQATIAINWNRYWAYMSSCSSDPAMHTRGSRWVAMHELGHILGFTHHNSGSSNANVMIGTRTCARFNSTPLSYRPLMQEALRTIDFPNDNDGFNLYDTDLSCYQPSGG